MDQSSRKKTSYVNPFSFYVEGCRFYMDQETFQTMSFMIIIHIDEHYLIYLINTRLKIIRIENFQIKSTTVFHHKHSPLPEF